MAKGKNVLTTGDVAKICNVAPRTVSKWFDNGQLKGYRIPGSKDRRIPVGELVRFMKLHNMPTAALPVGKIRVLLVDSDPHASDRLVAAIDEKADYDIQAVSTNFEAGVCALKFSPHVLIINLFAEGIDSAAICKSIRDAEDLQTIKIIALADHLGDSEAHALLQQGYDACVNDYANVDEVITTIDRATAIIY